MFYQIFGLMILAVFYTIYLGKMVQQKRAGIRTDQMGVGKSGIVKWIEMILKVTTYTTVLVEVVSIIRNTTVAPEWIRMIALVVAMIGTGFFGITVYTMRDSWRAGVPTSDKTELVTEGIFQISRNPAFFGFDLVYLGIMVAFFNLLLYVVSLLAVIMMHLQIVNCEEPALLEMFGDDYLNYQKQVNRYIGRKHR